MGTTELHGCVAQASDLFAQGKLGAAKELVSAHLDRDPDDQNALFLRAGINVRLGSGESAAQDLQRVLSCAPNDYESLVMLGLVRKNQGRIDEAIDFLSRAASLEPNNPSAFNTLGMCYLSLRQIDRAVGAFQKAVFADPRSGPAYQNLGLALRLAEKRHRALEAFRKAVELAPEHPTNFISLYEQLRRMGRKQEAILCLTEGTKLHPRCLPISLALASAYGDAQQPLEAEQLFEACLKIDPSAVQAYALWLQDQGRFEDAVQKLWNSIDLHPKQGLAYMALAEAKKFELSDGSPLGARVASVLQEPGVAKVSRMYLTYALAKSLEHSKSYEPAMGAFDEANRLAFSIYNEGRPFDHETGRQITDRTISSCGMDELSRLAETGSTSDTPIFIVGMVRSGTTLLDQIMSSHSLVRSAGETSFWMEESDRLAARPQHAPEELATRYLKLLDEEAGSSPRVTDKMPLNFLHLGPIHSTFPKAKLLHIRRNPVDTCLSIYATHFGGGPHFAYKKENIVIYYREYMRLMEHWRQVLPSHCFFELDYEELVGYKENVLREVLAFCGLPWEEACLSHEENRSAITTPSRWQARQPVYKTSIEKWRSYEPWLGAFEELKSVSHPR